MGAKLTTEQANIKLAKYGIKLVDKYVNQRAKSEMVCYCGKVFIAKPSSVWSEQTMSCGCARLGKNAKDITGMKFNYLTAVESTCKKLGNCIVWKFKCDCGNHTFVSISDATTGNTKSCGCWNKKVYTARIENFNKSLGRDGTTGIHNLKERLKPKYRVWRKSIIKRDCNICKKCNCSSMKIQVHHLNAWAAFPEDRFDIDNGASLCKECHILFHVEYGYGGNTKDQFLEYINNHDIGT